MIMRFKLSIIFLCISITGVFCAWGDVATDSLMRQLDYVIAHRDDYSRAKDSVLNSLQYEIGTTKDDHRRFDLLNRLYTEYQPYNTDSAYNISLWQESLARKIGDKNMISSARLNHANILGAVGMYHECLALMDSVRLAELPDYLVPYYYHIKRTVYGRMADYAAFPDARDKYLGKTNAYRDSIMSVNDTASLAYVITKADYMNHNGAPREAIGLMKNFMAANKLSEHEKAICAWTLGDSYARTGETALRKEILLKASISDLKSAVREYVSLRALAAILYEEGDIDRAYRYMTIAMDDAVKCNARQRIIEISDYYPEVNGIYIQTIEKQKQKLIVFMAVIGILALSLICLLFYMRRQMLRIAKARKDVEEALDREHRLTEELRISNDSLSAANDAIAENSELKEVYIGRYMDQCISYIEKLDVYRKSLYKLLSGGKTAELKETLKNTSVTDHELKAFYEQFDKTFLSLFPDFIEDFNKLLLPEGAIVPKREGSLTPELRIFALIRLGIADSDKIAKFLRYSLTTIYNYRTKVRNKARGDRNALEAEVMKIDRHTKLGDTP